MCVFVFIFNYERSYIFANHILPFVKITVEDQDCPVSLYFKPEKVTSIPEYLGNAPTYFAQTSRTSEAAIGGKNSCERCWKKVPMPRNTAASKIDDDAISLLWQLWCHCNLVHNNFLYLSNPAVAVIFPNLCWWQRTLCSNTGGIDPEKKTIEPHLKSSFLILSYQDFSVALWAGGGIDCSFLLMRMIFSFHCSCSAFILASVRKQVAICHLRNERRLGRTNLRKTFWDCYCWSQ